MDKECSEFFYKSKDEAMEDARFIRNQKRATMHSKSNKKQNPYKCKVCGLWHLTTMSKKEMRKTLTSND